MPENEQHPVLIEEFFSMYHEERLRSLFSVLREEDLIHQGIYLPFSSVPKIGLDWFKNRPFSPVLDFPGDQKPEEALFLAPYCDFITINSEKLLVSYEEVQKIAARFMQLGFKQVLIYGVQCKEALFAQDYWTNGVESFWIGSKKPVYTVVLSLFPQAIAAARAAGFSLQDATVLGKMVVTQKAMHSFNTDFLTKEYCLPYISKSPLKEEPLPFAACKLGLYPVVDSSLWLEKLLPLGLPCIQLRIKESTNLETEIKKSVALAKQYKTPLLINDHWEEAIYFGADGVHLGQEDMDAADIEAIYEAGLYLGLSTHCHYEVARAHRFRPSYIACGPIFETPSKKVDYEAQGLDSLLYWCKLLSYPVVAIGGIGLNNLQMVLDQGVQGVAVISAICNAADPIIAAHQLLAAIRDAGGPS